MRLSVWPNAGQSWADLLEVATHAEATGWDGVWIADHFMPFMGDTTGPMHEAWGLLGGLAALVPRVRLGTLVCGNTYRHPAVLANQAVTTDHVSGGRVVLGLGAGWQQNEHDAYGIELPPVKERLDRLEEACEVITSLIAEKRTTFAGKHYQLDDAPLEPKPVNGRLPLLIGGGGEKRTLRIAAKFADEWNVWGTPESFAGKSAVLDERCAEIDRDPATIARSTQAMVAVRPSEGLRSSLTKSGRPTLMGDLEELRDGLGRYVEAGCDEFIAPDWVMGAGAARLEALDTLAEAAKEFRQA